MEKITKLSALVLLALFVSSSNGQTIDNLDDLLAFIAKDPLDPFSRIGVLSMSNFNSIRNRLPPNAQPLVFVNEEELTNSVLNGTIVAGLTSGLPEKQYHDKLFIIPSGSIALHNVFMAPDFSTDFPNGVKDPSLSAHQLSIAINAAIAMMQRDGVDQQLAVKNGPKDITQAFTCKVANLSQFKLPNKKDAVGLLADVLKTKTLRLLADGPSNWGDNDGNYLVDPPIGFYPDLLTAIVNYFSNFSGPDAEKYGSVTIQRLYFKTGPFPWYKLFNGEAHMSEPYFLLDTGYGGSGKPCTTDADCPPSDEEKKSESCNSKNYCEQPVRPKVLILRSSCTSVGTQSVFTTRKSSGNSDKKSSFSSTAVGLTVTFGIVAIGLLIFIAFVLRRERRGEPLLKARP